MDIETRISTAMKRAVTLVEGLGIEDAELRGAALAKCFDAFYSEPKDHDVVTHTKPGGRSAEATSSIKGDQFWSALATDTSIEEGSLRRVYAIKNQQVYVSVARDSIRGDTIAEKSRLLSALVLLAYEQGLGMEWVPSQLLAEAAKHQTLYEYSRFGQSILEGDWIRPSGTGKGRRYKLSATGVKEALAYLKEVAAS